MSSVGEDIIEEEDGVCFFLYHKAVATTGFLEQSDKQPPNLQY